MRPNLTKPPTSKSAPPMSLPQYDSRLCTDPCAGPCAGCPDRIVCQCLKVTEEAIGHAIVSLGLRSIRDVRRATGAGDGCTCCHGEIRELLAVHAEVEVGELTRAG